MGFRAWYQKRLQSIDSLAIASAVATLGGGVILVVIHTIKQFRESGQLETDVLLVLLLLIAADIALLAHVFWNSKRVKRETIRREHTEQILRESQQKYNDLVDNAPVGIVVSSFDGRVFEANKTMVRMHGYESKDEFVQSPVADRFVELKDRERWVASVWDTGRVDALELQTRRKDGSLFWSSLTSIPRITETGEQQLTTVVQDVTKRRNAEDRPHVQDRPVRGTS